MSTTVEKMIEKVQTNKYGYYFSGALSPLTVNDVIEKTFISFFTLLLSSMVGYSLPFFLPVAVTSSLVVVSIIIAFAVGIWESFSKRVMPARVLAYSVFEGFAVGVISSLLNTMYPGIVVEAVLATLIVFAVCLLVFRSGLVKKTKTLTLFATVSITALIAYYIIDLMLVTLGVIPSSLNSLVVYGVPVGVLVGFFAVFLSSIFLVIDFYNIQDAIEDGVESRFAWKLAFSLVVTIVWMYVEILKLLTYFKE